MLDNNKSKTKQLQTPKTKTETPNPKQSTGVKQSENNSNYFSSLQETTAKNKINLDILDDISKYSIDELNDLINKYSAADPLGFGDGLEIDKQDGETKDGKIGNIEQFATGNCWLLSGVNALSYTEEGKKIIKNALEYHDGYTIVHLAIGDYVVRDNEVIETKGDLQYSRGDDDMIILELAVEKAIDEISEGKIILNEDAPPYLTEDDTIEKRIVTTIGNSSTEGGWPNELWYFLTGKASEYYDNDSEDTRKALDEFQNCNKKDIALACSLLDFKDKEGIEGLKIDSNDNCYIIDQNGETHELDAPHAYAIKSVDANTVTVIDPWDSSKEIVLSREQYLKLFDITRKIDLSENNEKKDFVSYATGSFDNNIYDDRDIEYDDKGNVKQIIYSDDFPKLKPTAIDTGGDGIIDQYYWW